MLKPLKPRTFSLKCKEDIDKYDIWACDIVSIGNKKWVMTSEMTMVPYRGYSGFYSHRNLVEIK